MPETRPGNTQLTVLSSGLIAMRTGYFITSFHSDMPLARAVITYCLWSSSSRLLRTTRMVPAGVAQPHQDQRQDQVLQLNRPNLAPLIGCIHVSCREQPQRRKVKLCKHEPGQDQRQQEPGRGDADKADKGEYIVQDTNTGGWRNRCRPAPRSPRKRSKPAPRWRSSSARVHSGFRSRAWSTAASSPSSPW